MVVSCEICGKQFDSFRGLNGHMNAHLIKRAEETFEAPMNSLNQRGEIPIEGEEVPRYVFHATPLKYWEEIQQQGGMIPQIGYMTYRAFLPRYKDERFENGLDITPEDYKEWLKTEIGGPKIWATSQSKSSMYGSMIEPMSLLENNAILQIDTTGLNFKYYNYEEYFTNDPIPLSSIKLIYFMRGERFGEEYPDYLLFELSPEYDESLEDDEELADLLHDENYERFLRAAEEGKQNSRWMAGAESLDSGCSLCGYDLQVLVHERCSNSECLSHDNLDAESYKPPASAVAAAKKGLSQRKEWGRGGMSPSEAKSQGIDSGVTRARKISSGSVSRHDVRRMSAFNRHRQNNRPEKKMPDGGPTAGTIAWNLWGGTSGVNWAKKKSATMNAERGCSYPCPDCGTMMYQHNSNTGFGSYCSCFKCGSNYITKPMNAESESKNAEGAPTADEKCDLDYHLRCHECRLCLDCNLEADAGGNVCRFCTGESIERFDAEAPHYHGDCDDCKQPMMLGKEIKNRSGVSTLTSSKICQECDEVVCGSCQPQAKVCPHCNESFNADFGPVDEEGQLAKALAAVREKSKRYAPTPLRLTKLPHPDQKSLKDFEAENTDKIKSVISDIRNYPQLDSFTDEQLLLMGLDCLALRSANNETAFEADEWKLLPRDSLGRWQKPVRSESINELRESLQTSVPAISELLNLYGGDNPNNRYKLYNDLQSLKIDAMDAALPDDTNMTLDNLDMSWMTPREYYEYILEEPIDVPDDTEDDSTTIEFQERLVRYTAMTMLPQEVESLIKENAAEITEDLFADNEEADSEISFLNAVKRYQKLSEQWSAEE